MRNPHPNHSGSILLSIILLIVCGGLFSIAAPTGAHANGGSPLRLRLRVEQNTLRSDESMKIWAEFLDGNYNQVPNDGTRKIRFEVQPRTSGSISPPDVDVKPGEWSAYTRFNPGRQGRVLIRTYTEGLDPDETFIQVTRPAASLMSQILEIIEPVAYAQTPAQFKFLNDSVKTEAGLRAKLQIDLSLARAGDKVKISTASPATIFHKEKPSDEKEKRFDNEMELAIDRDGGSSNEIFISSKDEGRVSVMAELVSRGLQASARVEFTPPSPRRICFLGETPTDLASNSSPCLTKWEMPSTLTDFRISFQFADGNGRPIKSDAKRKIFFKTGNRSDPVEFGPPSYELDKDQGVARIWVYLKPPLPRKELVVMAECADTDHDLIMGKTSIFIRNPNEKLIVKGPSQWKRGTTSAEFTIALLDKDGNATLADEDRHITLTVSGGSLSQPGVTIPKNQESAKVLFTPYLATGNVVLKAESFGLTEHTKGIDLITPLHWLVLAALFGGLIGGISRYLPRSDKVEQVLPRAKLTWKSVLGSTVASLISGSILYVAMKIGFSQAMGLVLPASLDVGTGLAAFLFGSIGGYVGVGGVFDHLAALCQLVTRKKNMSPPAATAQIKNAAQP